MRRVKTNQKLSLTQMVSNRQLFEDIIKRQMFSSVVEIHPYFCNYMKTFNATINYIDIDSIDSKL